MCDDNENKEKVKKDFKTQNSQDNYTFKKLSSM